jgi:hypothetical protein
MAKPGRPKNPPSVSEMLKSVLPIEEIFDENEVIQYNTMVDKYMADFDKDDLTTGDMDDIMDLAKNRILEFRLLKEVKESPDKLLDVSTALEKIRKENNKLKENLSSRRKDRINPNEYKGFSIVDLAVAFDDIRKSELEEKYKQLTLEEEEMLESRKNYYGNRYDIDTTRKEDDD